MRPFEWNHISALFYDSMVCFLLPTCVFFYQWCLSGLSSQHYVSMIFNSVGKKMHTLPRCGLIFPFQMPYFLHWLLCSTLLAQLKPPEASEQAAKKVEGAALKLPPGLTRPDPANPSSEKMTSQPTWFCCAYFPKSVTNLHRLFNMSCTNTHFDMFFQKLRHIWVSYISWYVLGGMSLTCLPIFAWQWGRKLNNTEKMRPFEWNHIPALFYDSMVCFLLPKCVFFYQWCLSGLSSQHYVSMIFVKQCW